MYCCFSQEAQIEWQNTIGGNNQDYLWTLNLTNDGGYIMGGVSFSDISGDKTENAMGSSDFWVVKINSLGEVIWDNTIGGNGYELFSTLSLTSDGGYILGGTSSSNISGDKTENSLGGLDYWIVKINSSGVVEWDNTIGGNANDRLYSISQTSDGGFILGGYSDSNISGDKTENTIGSFGKDDFWLVKLTSNGIIEWQNTIGGNDVDNLDIVIQTLDGGYFLAGDSRSDISGDKTESYMGGIWDYWILKLDPIGNIVWQNTIGGSGVDRVYSAQQTSDLGYIIGGISGSGISVDKSEENIGSFDYWIVKIDSLGSILWENTIGGDNLENLRYIEEVNNGYVVSGFSESNISGDKTENSSGGRDFWILKLDSQGVLLGQETIGGVNDDTCTVIHQIGDGGYILGGYSDSNVSGDKEENSIGENDFWVMKIEDITLSNETLNKAPIVEVYPNPVNYILNIKSQYPVDVVLIYDLLGQVVYVDRLNKLDTNIDLSYLTQGTYLLKMQVEDKIIQKKLIKK